MAIRYAVASGNWSNTATWNGGTLPTSADDVYSNTFTVTIDISPTVLSISNATATEVTAGGTFVPTNGITMTCTGSGIVSGTSGGAAFLSSLTTGQSCSIVSNVFSSQTSNGVSVSNTAGGTLNITGNCSGTTSVFSPAGVKCVINSSNGTVNITGNCTGGNNAPSYDNPNCTLVNNSTGVMNVTGTITGGNSPRGLCVLNNSSGTFTHVGTVQAGSVGAAIGIGNEAQVTVLTGPFLTTANGINPVAAARWFWANSNVTPTYYQIRTANLTTIRPLYTADSVGGNPAITNVRSGTAYGPNNELTGTCAVPGAASVMIGVPVDNTVGTAAISASDIKEACSKAIVPALLALG